MTQIPDVYPCLSELLSGQRRKPGSMLTSKMKSVATTVKGF